LRRQFQILDANFVFASPDGFTTIEIRHSASARQSFEPSFFPDKRQESCGPIGELAFHTRLCVMAGQAPSGEWIIHSGMTVALRALLRDPSPAQ
jgi:hypothetical protein